MMEYDDECYEMTSLDYMIELSILKIRRMQITKKGHERLERLLIIGTLQEAITKKMKILQQEEREDFMNELSPCAQFLTILNEAVRNLGLLRIVRFGIQLPDNKNDIPKLRISGGGNRGNQVAIAN